MRELKSLTGRTVVIASEGTTLRGVIESATRSFVTLADVVDVDRADPVAVSGLILVPAARIKYVQVVI